VGNLAVAFLRSEYNSRMLKSQDIGCSGQSTREDKATTLVSVPLTHVGMGESGQQRGLSNEVGVERSGGRFGLSRCGTDCKTREYLGT
jgi:hypothetical protein